MLFGIKSVFKYLSGRDIADRNVAVYADDTFLVSYPRSGNTWTRFLIANLLHPEVEVGFANIDSRCLVEPCAEAYPASAGSEEPPILRSSLSQGHLHRA